ncbi:MAG: hypothetical protein ACI4RD_08010 [Kiritimatiellia bacterium]
MNTRIVLAGLAAAMVSLAQATEWPAAGETLTIPAGQTVTVLQEDMEAINALGKIVFADRASSLHFQEILGGNESGGVAPVLNLEGEGTVILEGATTTSEWLVSQPQTTAWLGTWELRKGKLSLGHNNALFNTGLTQLGDVYVREGTILMPKSCQNSLTRTRLHLGGRLSCDNGGYASLISLCQVEVLGDAACMYVNRAYNFITLAGFDATPAFISLNGHTLTLEGSNSYYFFTEGWVKGPGTVVKSGTNYLGPRAVTGGPVADFMFSDASVTLKMQGKLSNYIAPDAYFEKTGSASHPACPQLATLEATGDLTLEHRHDEAHDCGHSAGFLWAGPVRIKTTLTLAGALAEGETGHFLPFDLGALSGTDAEEKTIGFSPAVFTNAVVRYAGAVASNVRHEGDRWDGRFEILPGASIGAVMKIANAEGAVGAVHQRGGEVTMADGSAFGAAGTYPAYVQDGGTLTMPSMTLAGAYGQLRLKGGTNTIGTLTLGDSRSDVILGGSGTVSGVALGGDRSLVAIEDAVTLDMGWSTGVGEGLIALNGGVFKVNFYASDKLASRHALAFNGGIREYTYGGYPLYEGHGWIRVYERGGGVRHSSADTRMTTMPTILEPQGNVLLSIAVSDELKDRVWQHPPAVEISDATGSNAVAVVDYDFTSGKVTNITVVCRGENFTAPTANLVYAEGVPLLETPLVCAVGPCAGGDFLFANADNAASYYFRNQEHWDWHGATVVDLDQSNILPTKSQSDRRYAAGLLLYYNDAEQPKFLNSTNLILKSGCVYSVSGRGLNLPFPNCQRLDLRGGYLAGGDAFFPTVVLRGAVTLCAPDCTDESAGSHSATVRPTGRLIVDASQENVSLRHGTIDFTANPTIELTNAEGLLADGWAAKVLLDLSGTTIVGTMPAVTVPAALAGKVSVRWNSSTKRLTARARTGLVIIFR